MLMTKTQHGGARKSISKGRKVEVQTTSIKLKEAQSWLKMSKRTSTGWPDIRIAVNKALAAGIKPDDVPVISARVDGQLPTEKEIKSIESSINNYLEDIDTPYRIRYVEGIDKFLLALKSEIEAIVGSISRTRNGHSSAEEN